MISFKKIKPEIRVLAFDDGPFEFHEKGKTILIGAVFRGGQFMDGLLKEEIEIDGSNAEEKIISSVKKCKFKDLRVIMLDGITFAGFNIVNIQKIFEKTKLPVIAVTRKKIDFEKFFAAATKTEKPTKILECARAAGTVYTAEFSLQKKKGKFFFQCAGLQPRDAAEILSVCTTRAFVPEPLRCAHLIASGVVLGESVGRA